MLKLTDTIKTLKQEKRTQLEGNSNFSPILKSIAVQKAASIKESPPFWNFRKPLPATSCSCHNQAKSSVTQAFNPPFEANLVFSAFSCLQKRPAWLAIKGLDDLKTKLGHVIVMILLVGMFEKSKIVQPTCSLDLFLTAGSVLLCAGSLFLLSRLKPDAKPGAETAGLH